MIYGAICGESQLKPQNANLNRNCVTISLPEIGTGNRMGKLGKTWQRQHLYRRMARSGMKKSAAETSAIIISEMRTNLEPIENIVLFRSCFIYVWETVNMASEALKN